MAYNRGTNKGGERQVNNVVVVYVWRWRLHNQPCQPLLLVAVWVQLSCCWGGKRKHGLLLVSGLLLAACGRRETRPGGASGCSWAASSSQLLAHNKGKRRRERERERGRGKGGNGQAWFFCEVVNVTIKTLTPLFIFLIYLFVYLFI